MSPDIYIQPSLEPTVRVRLSALARSVMILIEAIVKRTSLKMTDSATVLQEIVKAAADERGEWHLPLTAKQRAAVQQVWACIMLMCSC